MVQTFTHREVTVFRASERHLCTLDIAEPTYCDCQLLLHAPWGTIAAAGNDWFEALKGLRGELEPAGWMIAVQGSRKQAFASGMIRNMVGAVRVHICEPGRRVTRADFMPIFAEAPLDDVVTLDEQAEWHRAWLASLPPRVPPDPRPPIARERPQSPPGEHS